MSFDKWFNEVELFSTRDERFFSDLDHHNPNSPGANQRMVAWLKAAFQAGYDRRIFEETDDFK